MARRADGTGKHPVECPVCGCPGVCTQNDSNPEAERTVWGYETNETLREQVEVLNQMLAAGLPSRIIQELRRQFDPAYARAEQWCEDTRGVTGEDEEDTYAA